MTRTIAGACALAVLLSACAEDQRPQVAASGDAGACVDGDGDGYGERCRPGPDCDDQDPETHTGCTDCLTPRGGCTCEPGTEPATCFLQPERDNRTGNLLCREGTRYCRDGLWSGCEDLFSYPLPQERQLAALVAPDAGPVACNACNPVCFRVSDTLDPMDGGLSGNSDDQVSWSPGGGLTLAQDPDASIEDPADGGFDPSACMRGTAPDIDCDGIPDEYDPYPDTPPFATANPTIFLDIGAGETGIGQVDLAFFLNSADVYFLVDQSASMSEERDQLVADLTTGDFINDQDRDCSDYDFDGMPNNELKSGGIIGAIRCIIRDSHFGVGLFREIPFYPYGVTGQLAFEHYQDITNDADAVRSGVSQLWTEGNYDWPEASMVALHSLVTGQGMYFGIDRHGVSPRTDCPQAHWGYPCFRDAAIPIVMLFTDAMMHNGPSNNHYPYEAANLGITAGSALDYIPVGQTNEDATSAYRAGDVTDTLTTFQSNTSGMGAHLTASQLSCLYYSGSPDAFYEFSVRERRSIVARTDGSQFDTVLGLLARQPPAVEVLADSGNGNETAASAQDLGSLNGRHLRIDGNTTGMAADYLGSATGCSAAAGSPDAVYTFNLSADTRVSLSAAGSAFDTVVSLYDQAPLTTTYAPNPGNENDAIDSATDLGDVYNSVQAMTGDSRAAGLRSRYGGAAIGCGADDLANDVVYRFDLALPTRVQVSSEGSEIDTVLGLLGETCTSGSCTTVGEASLAVPDTAESLASAADLGVISGQVAHLSGDTTAMDADLGSALVSCGADAAPDVVVRFDLAEPGDVTITAESTDFDEVLALVASDPLAMAEVAATNAAEDTDNAQDLGSLNGRMIRVAGGSTSGMVSDYGATELSCAPNTAGSGDAAYAFRLDTPTRVRIDTRGSGFDTVVSLHDGSIEPPTTVTTVAVPSSAETPHSAYLMSQSISTGVQEASGNTSGMRPDIRMHSTAVSTCHAGSDDLGPDAAIRFEVSAADTYRFTLESSFAHALAIYPEAVYPYGAPLVNYGDAGYHYLNPNQAGILDDWWFRARGYTDYNYLNASYCGARSSARDVFYEFTLDQTQTVIVSAENSSIDSVLLLYRWNDSGGGATLVNCDDDAGAGDDARFTATLTAGRYLAMLTAEGDYEEGGYRLEIKDSSIGGQNLVACGGGSAATTLDQVLNPGTYHAVVKGYGSSDDGNYTLTMHRASTSPSAGDAHEVACDDNGAGTDSVIERDLPAGDYYVVVSGASAGDEGPYALLLQDADNPPASPLACATDGSLEPGTLPAGTYWAAIKGQTPADSGAFDITIADRNPQVGQVLACDADSGGEGSSLIEQDLPAGSYYVVVKGDSATDEGAYRIAVRDIGNQQVLPLTCDGDSGPSGSAYLQADLPAGGPYHAVVKGDGPEDAGNYRLTLLDLESGSLGEIACDDNSGAGDTSRITRTLDPGTYYAAVKGYRSSASGSYQLTLGGGTTQSSRYVPPTWAETSAALLSRGVKVIPILSCHDDPAYGDGGACDETRTQAQDLANLTEALGPSLSPLVFDIDRDGRGLSSNVVTGIASLANYLEMDVKVALAFDPDPNPGFAVRIEAVDEAGDGCTGIADGFEHLNCVPGATPKFLIYIENPAAAPVPLNPDDPNGGYTFRAILIGDDAYTVDEVPVYVIPEDVVPDPGDPVYYSSGEYWQDVESPGCTGNQRPDWRDLTWNAEIPVGTQVAFYACTAEDSSDLDQCSPTPIATVRGGPECSGDADCGLGYCDPAVSACQVATGNACSSDAQCPSNASCRSSVCTFESQPVYVGGNLGTENYQSYLRMTIVLSGDPPVLNPPVLNSWDLTYYCDAVN